MVEEAFFLAEGQKTSETQAHRRLNLPGWSSKVWRSKRWIGRASDAVSKLMGYGPKEIRGAINLVDALHIAMVENVEAFDARFRREMLGSMKFPLQA